LPRERTVFYCSECEYESHKWLGRCPGCGDWNTLTERKYPGKLGGMKEGSANTLESISLKDIAVADEKRMSSGIKEFDRVIGGGAIAGSVILLGGDPGIGKSTLMLQVASRYSVAQKTLYASGEESLRQLKIRAERLGVAENGLQIVATTDLEPLLDFAEKSKPDVLIVDSVQSMRHDRVESAAGSVSQIRAVTDELVRLAKLNNTVIFLVGHVTKEGVMAGPKLLEHMVDTVLYLEGERYHSFRILRGVKNRFGSTSEIGVFMMEAEGLVEIANPSHYFISPRENQSPGAVITASMEGSRPLLVEIQSLVAPTFYPTPRRTTTGVDHNRVALVMAILEKHAGISFLGMDTFVNAVGGVRLFETAVDLALAFSLASSLKGINFNPESVVFGELGLTGELRPVSKARERFAEASKLGFKNIIVPSSNLGELKKELLNNKDIKVTGVGNIKEAIDICLKTVKR